MIENCTTESVCASSRIIRRINPRPSFLQHKKGVPPVTAIELQCKSMTDAMGMDYCTRRFLYIFFFADSKLLFTNYFDNVNATVSL